jgi:uncharacterized protein
MTQFTPQNSIAWFEIPVSDMNRAKAFYSAVLQNELKDENMGPNETSVFVYEGGQGISGHLYPGKPAAKGAGSTVHLYVPSPLEDSLERVKAAGGEVVSGIVKIPPGRFAYCLDPDGNSIGLFTR